jgi:hypothetical protein
MLAQYNKYHDHKETMAYSAFALYAAAFAWLLVSKEWPPDWPAPMPVVTVAAAWLLALWFIGWQLKNRRLAAIRTAAAERLLASWVTRPPSSDDLAPWKGSIERPSRLGHLVGFLCPPLAPLGHADLADSNYPGALVSLWLQQSAGRGTGATRNEVILTVAIWLLFLAVAVKTWLA